MTRTAETDKGGRDRDGRATHDPRPPLVFCGLILVVFAALLFAHPRAPILGDYGEWTYHGVLLRNLLTGHPDAGYMLKHYPVPNSLTTAGLGVLMLVTPWAVAAKMWLCAVLVLGLGCGWALNRASMRRDGAMLWLLPGAVLCGLDFWWGFSNFLLGVCLAMLLAAMLLRGVQSRWAYGVVLGLLFISHMIPFVFGCLMMAGFALQTGRWGVLWQTGPGLLLTGWYVEGRFLTAGNADGRAGMEASARYLSGRFFAFKVNSYLKCWGLVNPALTEHDSIAVRVLGEPVFAGLVLVDLVLAIAVGWILWASARRAFRERSADRFLWGTVGVFVVLFVAMPGEALGISDPGGRMVQTAVWVGVMAASTTWRWERSLLAAGSGLLVAANAVLFAAVGFATPAGGATGGWLPERVRVFAHVYYADRADFAGSLQRREMDRAIYPTAMFLKR